ncbi:unnamed protein product [marine sediment metagenome]|uniref:Uncharacterized protein n=1 Tax=marine sediment metagenome TaxID=412755 RepID=X1GY06_9ZZZZ
MWDSLKEVWPKTFLTTTVLLIAYGLFCGVRMVLKDERKRRSDKKKDRQNSLK